MRDHRQGNDLAVLWSIFKDGEPFDLRGRSLKLYLKNLHERKEVVDFSVTGNEIHWTFYGKDQDTLGKHSLILVANEDEKGMITTDACDFVRLVSCSCKLQGGEDAPNVETESIELTSTLEFVAGADYDDTALWKELENKVDKVEGLGLSEENYTADEKEKLAGLENYDDTELREDIANLAETKADKSLVETIYNEFNNTLEQVGQGMQEALQGFSEQLSNQESELTELSAEVSGLSERIDNLPSGESDVFKAEYGVTTYEEVSEAYNQGKIIHCDYESRCYELAVFTGNIACFSALNTTTSFLLMLNAESSWSKASYSLENTDNRVDTIQADAKPYQYPSAKAVYDFVNNTLGTLINGEY